jgi:aspartate/methionine/tyrosine aminotransferase
LRRAPTSRRPCVSAEHGALLVYDNAYSEIAFDGYRPPSIFEIDGARDVAVEFHSFSKTYNMTGWRIGWAAGGAEAIAALARVKSFVDTGQFLAIQAAAAAALGAWESWVPGNVAEFRERRDAWSARCKVAVSRRNRPPRRCTCGYRVPGGPSEPSSRAAR